MIPQSGQRVYWGTPEVIYLEGTVVAVDEGTQRVVVHVECATPHSAHLIGTDVPFAANGIALLQGTSPPGTTTEYNAERRPPPKLNDDEKIHKAAAAAVHQQFGYNLQAGQEEQLIQQVEETLKSDPSIRKRIIDSMNEILRREW
jgi:hypothetical protein